MRFRDDVEAQCRRAFDGPRAELVIVTASSMATVAQSLKCVDRGGTQLKA